MDLDSPNHLGLSKQQPQSQQQQQPVASSAASLSFSALPGLGFTSQPPPAPPAATGTAAEYNARVARHQYARRARSISPSATSAPATSTTALGPPRVSTADIARGDVTAAGQTDVAMSSPAPSSPMQMDTQFQSPAAATGIGPAPTSRRASIAHYDRERLLSAANSGFVAPTLTPSETIAGTQTAKPASAEATDKPFGNPLLRLSRELLDERKPAEVEWSHEREMTRRMRSVDLLTGRHRTISMRTDDSVDADDDDDDDRSMKGARTGRDDDDEGTGDVDMDMDDDQRPRRPLLRRHPPHNASTHQLLLDEQDYFSLAPRRVLGSSRLNPASSSLASASTPSSAASSPTIGSFPSPRTLSPRLIPRNSPPPPLLLGKRSRASSITEYSVVSKKRIAIDPASSSSNNHFGGGGGSGSTTPTNLHPLHPSRTNSNSSGGGFTYGIAESQDSESESGMSVASNLSQSGIGLIPIPNNAGKQVAQLLNIQGASSGFSKMSLD
ncbi:hypothetical protein RI367_004789 [Sorochytrium milnesiophthora]